MLIAQILVYVFSGILLMAAVGIAWVVYRDARHRGVSDFIATLWAIGALLLAPVIIPLYLLIVARSRDRSIPFSNRELWMTWLFSSLFFALVAGALVSPPNPFTQLSVQLVLLPVITLILYLLIFKDYGAAVSSSF